MQEEPSITPRNTPSTQTLHQHEYRNYIQFREKMILRDTKCFVCSSPEFKDYSLEEILENNKALMDSDSMAKVENQIQFLRETLNSDDGFVCSDQEIKFKLLQFTEQLEQVEIHPRELFIPSCSLYQRAYKYYFADTRNDASMSGFHTLNKMMLTTLFIGLPFMLKHYAIRRVCSSLLGTIFKVSQ
ncbi:hypothetical protein FDP41_008439 [Naegleria fowleri]|uniref:Uncharacterized protein n=1 Tax=Naegleria fowleri TaxID=5763 RepID=A0A6A5BEM1_NAEFO|nr:uncharacterized protein FDP41_008439 [Naegleria fowleri]KAF0973232.1 hypothetical protein FDP41_008439 [Naegleria fowleri]CAG4713035.1 unnamed protein product [Naegleria fowleri]